MLAALIVVASLWAMTISGGVFYARLRNRTSIPPSPTPPTTPTPVSDTSPTQMMTILAETFRASLSEMREMVVDMTQGRVSQRMNGERVTLPTPNESSIDYDDDSIPTHPGIEAVLAREANETELARLAREREELQRELMDKQDEMLRLQSDDSSGQPWNREATESDPTSP